MSSEWKLMEESAFSVCLIKTEGNILELFIREHRLVKTLMNNLALFLYLVM